MSGTDAFDRLAPRPPSWALTPPSRPVVVAVAIGAVAGLGVVDLWTGPEISFSIFYLLPVALATWGAGNGSGTVVSLLSAATWLVADLAAGAVYTSSWIPYWNAAVRLAFFIVFVQLFCRWRRGQERQAAMLHAVQQRLLPREIPQIGGFSISGCWRPAQAVGGDYFDVLRTGDTSLALCIADVSGKGMEAALIMSNLQAAVRAMVGDGVTPGALCGRLNRLLCDNVLTGRYVTLFFAHLEGAGGRLIYALAGHCAPILVRRDGSRSLLDRGHPVLGVLPSIDYGETEVLLAPGDRLLLYTDGLTEVTDLSGEQLGEERLAELLTRHRRFGATALQDTLLRAVADFNGGRIEDDLTLLLIAADDAPGGPTPGG